MNKLMLLAHTEERGLQGDFGMMHAKSMLRMPFFGAFWGLLWFVSWILLIGLLIAMIRYFWKKGNTHK